MPTGYGYLEHNRSVRAHWLRRLGAGAIDVAVVFTPLTLAILLTDPPNVDIIAGLVSGFGWFMYSMLFEWYFGQTLGKRLMHLKVQTLVEYRTLPQAFVRSLPKMFWFIFLPIDVLLGLAIDGDPRQRFSDTVAKTTVILYEPEMAKIMKRSQPSKNYKERAERELTKEEISDILNEAGI